MPKKQFQGKVDVGEIINVLSGMGFFVITKSKPKDPVDSKYWGDKFFASSYYYPHTPFELISVSDIVINFDSTAIMEIIMLGKPVINFRVKPHVNPLGFLYDGVCSVQMLSFDITKFKNEVQRMIDCDFTEQIKTLKKKYLFDETKTASLIIEAALNEYRSVQANTL